MINKWLIYELIISLPLEWWQVIIISLHAHDTISLSLSLSLSLAGRDIGSPREDSSWLQMNL
jgi:hypothetical protein